MGWGDELMAAGQAYQKHLKTHRQVAIVDRWGTPRWSPIWEGLPFIARTMAPGVVTVVNGALVRPYIDYPFTSAGHGFSGWRARDHRPVVALNARDRRVGHSARAELGRFVLIEPTIKRLANPNKAWTRWQEVVDAMPDVRFVQCSSAEDAGPQLRGTSWYLTPTFRDACGLLEKAAAYVGHEGGMHHAAAALYVPAVVVFGGSPSVEATGYEDHVNFGTDRPCGRWQPCAHCRQVMDKITPDQIVAALRRVLEPTEARAA